MGESQGNRHILVIGASAGGVDALRRLTGALPRDLPASVFIVLHVGERTRLPEILNAASGLPAGAAVDGEAIEPGRIYVAPPGRHLLLHDGHVMLGRGPRENHARPAIDPLFRSAACTFGGAVIGVVLTGALGDGAAGLEAVKRCGGVTVVQDPADAVAPEMPRAVLRRIDVDHCLPVDDMGTLLVRLVGEKQGETPEIPYSIRLEMAIATQRSSSGAQAAMGTPSGLVCPVCHGPLWEIVDCRLLRYRCHAGHAVSADALLATQAEEAENTLRHLVRSHRQRAALVRRMAQQEVALQRSASADRLRQRAREYEEDAELLLSLLRNDTVEEQIGPAGVTAP